MHRSVAIGIVLATLIGGAVAAAPAEQRRQEAPAAAEASKVDLNRANSQQLQELPGIGTRTAELIIAYREEHGRFEKVEDLMNVRGIGERTFLRLRELVEVDTTAASRR